MSTKVSESTGYVSNVQMSAFGYVMAAIIAIVMLPVLPSSSSCGFSGECSSRATTWNPVTRRGETIRIGCGPRHQNRRRTTRTRTDRDSRRSSLFPSEEPRDSAEREDSKPVVGYDNPYDTACCTGVTAELLAIVPSMTYSSPCETNRRTLFC